MGNLYDRLLACCHSVRSSYWLFHWGNITMTTLTWIILWWFVTGLIVALLFGAVVRGGQSTDGE